MQYCIYRINVQHIDLQIYNSMFFIYTSYIFSKAITYIEHYLYSLKIDEQYKRDIKITFFFNIIELILI